PERAQVAAARALRLRCDRGLRAAPEVGLSARVGARRPRGDRAAQARAVADEAHARRGRLPARRARASARRRGAPVRHVDRGRAVPSRAGPPRALPENGLAAGGEAVTERKQAAGRMSYERALRSWQEQAIPERAAPDPAERQVAIEALASAIRSGPARLEAQRKRRLWAVLGAGVAAAAAALFVFTGADPVPRAHVAESAPEAALAPASPAPLAVLRVSTVDGAVTLAEDGGTTKRLAAGERFEVAAGRAVRVEAPQRATIALWTEIDVFLNAETSLSLRAAKPTHPRLELGLGRVELDVHGPARDRRVIVQTPDARVTVRGTRFSVDVRPRASG